METRSLAVFLSVADTLNFSRSSEALHMSVSAVSRTIKRLEEELSQQLLERDNRQVRLTRAGREFREYARNALSDWQRLQSKLGTDKNLVGEVRLYCSVTATHSILAPILAAFRRLHPAVDILMHTGDQADGISRVLDGQDDIAVSGQPLQLPQRLDFLPLLETPLHIWAPTANCAVQEQLDTKEKGSNAYDWSSIPFILPERGVTKEMLDKWLNTHGIQPRVYAQVAGHEAIVAMVSLGLGVGVAPSLVVEKSAFAAGVKPLALADNLPALTVGLCGLKQRLSNPVVKSLWNVAGQTATAVI
ncbi:MAG: HTH-type transcriptional activator IlvY [Pseudomonadota bacterium]